MNRPTNGEVAEIRERAAVFMEPTVADRDRLLGEIDALTAQLAKARRLANRLLRATPNTMHGWSDEECDLLGELCDALGVKEDS